MRFYVLLVFVFHVHFSDSLDNVEQIQATRLFRCVNIFWDAEDFQHYGDNTKMFLTLRKYNNQTKNETVALQNQAFRTCSRDGNSVFVVVEYSVILYQLVNNTKTEKNRSVTSSIDIQEKTENMDVVTMKMEKKKGSFVTTNTCAGAVGVFVSAIHIVLTYFLLKVQARLESTLLDLSAGIIASFGFGYICSMFAHATIFLFWKLNGEETKFEVITNMISFGLCFMLTIIIFICLYSKCSNFKSHSIERPLARLNTVQETRTKDFRLNKESNPPAVNNSSSSRKDFDEGGYEIPVAVLYESSIYEATDDEDKQSNFGHEVLLAIKDSDRQRKISQRSSRDCSKDDYCDVMLDIPKKQRAQNKDSHDAEETAIEDYEFTEFKPDGKTAFYEISIADIESCDSKRNDYELMKDDIDAKKKKDEGRNNIANYCNMTVQFQQNGGYEDIRKVISTSYDDVMVPFSKSNKAGSSVKVSTTCGYEIPNEDTLGHQQKNYEDLN